MHISYVYIQINVSKKRKKNTIFKYSHDETFATRGDGKVSFHVTGDANAFSRTRFLRVAICYRWDGHWWLSVKIFIPIHRKHNPCPCALDRSRTRNGSKSKKVIWRERLVNMQMREAEMKARRWRMAEIKMFVSFREMERRRDEMPWLVRKKRKRKEKREKKGKESLTNAREKIWR